MAEEDAFTEEARRAAEAAALARPVPTPTPVTELLVRPGGEVIIRTGPPDLVRALGGQVGLEGVIEPECTCPRPFAALDRLAFAESEEELLGRIEETTAMDRDQILDELLKRVLVAAARDYAKELGVG